MKAQGVDGKLTVLRCEFDYPYSHCSSREACFAMSAGVAMRMG